MVRLFDFYLLSSTKNCLVYAGDEAHDEDVEKEANGGRLRTRKCSSLFIRSASMSRSLSADTAARVRNSRSARLQKTFRTRQKIANRSRRRQSTDAVASKATPSLLFSFVGQMAVTVNEASLVRRCREERRRSKKSPKTCLLRAEKGFRVLFPCAA